MSHTRYDGAYLAPATRLRAHGGSRRAFDRVVSIREATSRRAGNGHFLVLDDATLATFGRDRAELERAGHSTYPF